MYFCTNGAAPPFSTSPSLVVCKALARDPLCPGAHAALGSLFSARGAHDDAEVRSRDGVSHQNRLS